MSLPHKPDYSAASDDNMQEERFNQNRGCNCFCIPCFQRCYRGSPHWEGIRSEKKEQWWMRCYKKVREWSEISAGPKWKTFIRRLNYGGGGRDRPYMKNGGFRYDPMSYANNFDESAVKNDDDAVAAISFSARYASLPNSAKSSMDLGKDAPDFSRRFTFPFCGPTLPRLQLSPPSLQLTPPSLSADARSQSKPQPQVASEQEFIDAPGGGSLESVGTAATDGHIAGAISVSISSFTIWGFRSFLFHQPCLFRALGGEVFEIGVSAAGGGVWQAKQRR
ncbi:NHL domain protein [Arachis hypogaea]|nr:NHL domain protein [Arachis hypogaea]